MSFRLMFGFPYNICAKEIKVRSEDLKRSRKHDNNLRLLRGITSKQNLPIIYVVLHTTYLTFFLEKIARRRKKFPIWYLPTAKNFHTDPWHVCDAVSYLCLEDKYYYAATCRSTQQVFFRTDRRRATDFPICCCVCNHYKIVLRHAAFISMLLKPFFKMTRVNYLFYSSLAKAK